MREHLNIIPQIILIVLVDVLDFVSAVQVVLADAKMNVLDVQGALVVQDLAQMAVQGLAKEVVPEDVKKVALVYAQVGARMNALAAA